MAKSWMTKQEERENPLYPDLCEGLPGMNQAAKLTRSDLLALLELLLDRAPMAGQYNDANGLHCHQCPSCSTVWQHPRPPASLSDECEDRWHQCPSCGTEQRDKMKLADVKHVDHPWKDTK